MKNNKNTKGSPKPVRINGMVSINPNGFWALGEMCYEDNLKGYK